MKPRLVLVLCLITLLAACAPETASPPPAPGASPTPTRVPPTRTPTAPPEPTAEPVEPIRLTGDDIAGEQIALWHPWDGERETLLGEFVAAFNTANDFGLQVTAVRAHDLQEEIARALAAGEPPDLAFGFAYHVRGWFRAAPPVDWTPYLLDPAWGLAPEERSDFFPEFLGSAQVDGRQIGLPFYRTAEVLLYNVTWAGELGFDSPPSTPDQLAAQACAANASLRADADPGNDGEGGLMVGYEPAALAAWLTALGGSVTAPGAEAAEGELSAGGAYAFDRPENVTALQTLRGLLDELCAWLPEGEYPHDEFAARRGLLLPSTLAGPALQAEAMAAAGSPDAWQAIPYPTTAGGRSPLFYGPDLVLFPTTPERQLAAWVFARWLLAPENLARWSEVTGYFPVRASTLDLIAEPPADFEAWLAGGTMFTPPASWVEVQWAVSEMARMLFSPFTATGEIPALSAELDAFAEDLDGGW